MMRTGSPVEYVTQDMQTVDYETLYKVTECRNEVVGTSGSYDCIYNGAEIGLFVAEIIRLVHQFFYDICILLGETLAHL
jgi:hypothetical protein